MEQSPLGKASHVKAFVFDLDGTLLDTLTDLAASVNHALQLHGLPPRSRAEVRRFLGNGVRNLMLQSVGGRLDEAEFEQALNDFRTHYGQHCMDATQPFPGIMDLLETLHRRQIPMAIVSNKLQSAVTELNRRFFAQYITTAVGESETVRRKPRPDAVLKALEEMGVQPAEAVYVGDSEVDWETARNAGTQLALVLWGFRDEADLRRLPGTDLFATRPANLLQQFVGDRVGE